MTCVEVVRVRFASTPEMAVAVVVAEAKIVADGTPPLSGAIQYVRMPVGVPPIIRLNPIIPSV